MTLEPLLQASLAIQVHVASILAVAVLSAVQWLLPKGTGLHRSLGWTWAGLMMVACVSSFFVHSIRLWGPFSPIHLQSVATLVLVALAVRAARQGRVRAHRRAMALIVLGGLVVAGGFTLLPGRIMHDVVFGHDVATVRPMLLQVSGKQ